MTKIVLTGTLSMQEPTNSKGIAPVLARTSPDQLVLNPAGGCQGGVRIDGHLAGPLVVKNRIPVEEIEKWRDKLNEAGVKDRLPVGIPAALDEMVERAVGGRTVGELTGVSSREGSEPGTRGAASPGAEKSGFSPTDLDANVLSIVMKAVMEGGGGIQMTTGMTKLCLMEVDLIDEVFDLRDQVEKLAQAVQARPAREETDPSGEVAQLRRRVEALEASLEVAGVSVRSADDPDFPPRRRRQDLE